MNCPSRTDETIEHEGWNQNPPSLAADLTTRQDLNGITNSRAQRDHILDITELAEGTVIDHNRATEPPAVLQKTGCETNTNADRKLQPLTETAFNSPLEPNNARRSWLPDQGNGSGWIGRVGGFARRSSQVLMKYGKFIGPGFMIAVAYIDPGNYSTDVSAGASTRFGLLFIVLMSNIFAIFLQSLCIKLGTVTGLNLAEHCRAHLPKWLNLTLYLFAESAVIATDIAEVRRPCLRRYRIYAYLCNRSLAQQSPSIF